MQSLFDYLARKDHKKMEKPNEVDLYIFSILSYAKFEKMMKLGLKSVSMSNFAQLYFATPIRKGQIAANMARMVQLMGKCPRYKGIKLGDFRSVIDAKVECQFAALTIILPDGNIFLSFRGTDETLIAWKEDANLSYLDIVPSQVMAKDYLIEMAAKYPHAKIYIGGHSKGGSLAVYAASTVEHKLQRRIAYIMDGDSPGLRDWMLSSPGYLSILSKVHSFVPEYDLVGLIFRKKTKVSVISSSRRGVWQHYYLSWNVDGDRLARKKEVESGDCLDEGSLNAIMQKMSTKQIKDYIDTIYDLVKEEGVVVTLTDLLNIKHISKITKRFSSLPKEKQKEIRRISIQVVQGILTATKMKP